MYGAQTLIFVYNSAMQFENDVEMYGAQTETADGRTNYPFENDVEMYGAQTFPHYFATALCLRMMQKCMVLKPANIF